MLALSYNYIKSKSSLGFFLLECEIQPNHSSKVIDRDRR
nr:MAG TPA: hypothetical protein [Caudoviricetes sp.]